MTSFKIKDWDEGKYEYSVPLPREEVWRLEVLILEDVKKRFMPEGTVVVRANVEVEFWVQGTADAVASCGTTWKHIWQRAVVVEKKGPE